MLINKNVYADIKSIVEQARKNAILKVNFTIRVEKGGHPVNVDKIRSRYGNKLKN